MLNSINQAAENLSLPDNAPARQVKAQQNVEDAAKNAAGKTAALSKTSLELAVEELNKAMETTRTEQHFELDDDLGRPIVKIVNSETKEVIRQIPSEEAIRISKNIGEMIGLLMDDRI